MFSLFGFTRLIIAISIAGGSSRLPILGDIGKIIGGAAAVAV
jgi:hypothetical protein